MDRPRSLRHRLLANLPTGRLSPTHSVMVAAFTVVVATAFALLLDRVPQHAPFITYYPGVLAAGVFGGAVSGLLAIAMAAGLAAYLWLPNVPGRDVQLLMLGTFTLSSLMMIGAVWAMQVALEARNAAEHHAQLLAGEMSHRLGNLVQLIQSIANATFKAGQPFQEQKSAFDARLGALGAALTAHKDAGSGPVELADLLARTLRPYAGTAIDLNGESLRIPPHLSHRVALIVHELATNASKYGALTCSAGRVTVTWSRKVDGGAVIRWQERGGPPVQRPSRTGYGTRLISALLPPEMGAVVLDWDEAGLTCEVTLKPLA